MKADATIHSNTSLLGVVGNPCAPAKANNENFLTFCFNQVLVFSHSFECIDTHFCDFSDGVLSQVASFLLHVVRFILKVVALVPVRKDNSVASFSEIISESLDTSLMHTENVMYEDHSVLGVGWANGVGRDPLAIEFPALHLTFGIEVLRSKSAVGALGAAKRNEIFLCLLNFGLHRLC